MEMNHPEGTTELYEHLGVHSHNPIDLADELVNAEMHPDGLTTAADQQFDYQNQIDKKNNTSMSKVVNSIFPYVAIFIGAVLVFLVLFTGTSISSIFSSIVGTQPKAAVTKTVIPSAQLSAYNTWIRSYFYEVTDPTVLDPDNDISGNGLTNYEKFLLGLNPTKQDSLGLGMTDTEALMQNIDPLTGTNLTDAQVKFVAANIDLEAASNKVSLAAANTTPEVAGASIVASSFVAPSNSPISSTSYASVNSNSNTAAPSINLNRDSVAVNNNVNGELDIPALKITVPLIWSADPKNFETDLTSGVVHYPGTAMPGALGTSYISGHSSNYAWIKSKYNNIFAHLGDLKQYDSFTITVKNTAGKTVIFHYVISGSQIYSSSDQTQFASTGKSIVQLSTCWPIGTANKRLVVTGQLTQIEQ